MAMAIMAWHGRWFALRTLHRSTPRLSRSLTNRTNQTKIQRRHAHADMCQTEEVTKNITNLFNEHRWGRLALQERNERWWNEAGPLSLFSVFCSYLCALSDTLKFLSLKVIFLLEWKLHSFSPGCEFIIWDYFPNLLHKAAASDALATKNKNKKHTQQKQSQKQP